MSVFLNESSKMTQNEFIEYINGGLILGGDYRGEKALTNSDIFTGINIIAGDIAQSPFKPKKGVTVSDDILNLLNKEPKKNQSHYMMMYAAITNLILTGNAYVLIHKQGGKVAELEFVESKNVNVIQDISTGNYTYDVTMPYGSMMYRAKPEEILHFRISSKDGWLGSSPLNALEEEVALQSNGLKVLNNFFSKGVFAGGILKLKNGTVNNATKRKIKDDFETANNGGGTVVLDDTQEYTPNTINTEILKLIQANKFSTQQIAKVLGIPVSRFGQELVNSSDTNQNDIYLSSTIAMYEASICDEINLKLGLDLELDIKKLSKDTYEDRLQKVAEGKVKSELSKALTINDARNYLGFEDIEGGNALLGSDNTNNEVEVNVDEE